MFAFAAAVGVVALTVAGARFPNLSADVPQPRQVAEGQRIVRRMHCESWHSVRDRGGIVGPALALGPRARDEAWVKAHFGNPQTVAPGAMLRLNDRACE